MGVYTRYKKKPDGFRALVELLESTPKARRDKMIEAGMREDPEYTNKALEYVLSFEDVLKMNQMELAELVAVAPPKMTAFAISPFDDAVKKRFLESARPPVLGELRDWIDQKVGPREIGGAQLKLVESARSLERKGLITTKRIP